MVGVTVAPACMSVAIKRHGTYHYYSLPTEGAAPAEECTLRGRKERAAAFALARITAEESEGALAPSAGACAGACAGAGAGAGVGAAEEKEEKQEAPCEVPVEEGADSATTPAAASGIFRINLIDSPGHFDFNAEVRQGAGVSHAQACSVDGCACVWRQVLLLMASTRACVW